MRNTHDQETTDQIAISAALNALFRTWKVCMTRDLTDEESRGINWIEEFVDDAKHRLQDMHNSSLGEDLGALFEEYCDYLYEKDRAERWMTKRP